MLFWIVWSILAVYVAYIAVLFWMRRSAAKTLDATEFSKDLRHGQLIDLREKDEFRAGHILGARNIPYSQFKARMFELRKDQPIYLYEQGMTISGRAAYRLKRKGYSNIFILKNGYDAWNGKVKKGY